MKLYDLERVETELGVDLPQDYREFILSFKRPRAQHNQTLLEALSEGAFNALIVDRPSALIKVNEATVEIGPIAGLRRWPLHFFIFGDDGVGNYYALDARAKKRSKVIFYDHERDDFVQLSRSFPEFVAAFLEGAVFDERLLHSGRAAQRKKDNRSAWSPPAFEFGPSSPAWQTDWAAFVDEYVRIVATSDSEIDRIRRINETFGRKPACWEGEVDWLKLGDYPMVFLKPRPFRKRASSLRFRFGRLIVGLDTHDSHLGTGIVTRIDCWRNVEIGGRIKLLILIGSGDSETPCIAMRNQDAQGVYEVLPVTWGGHVAEIVSPAPPESERNWRIVEEGTWIGGKMVYQRKKVLKRKTGRRRRR